MLERQELYRREFDNLQKASFAWSEGGEEGGGGGGGGSVGGGSGGTGNGTGSGSGGGGAGGSTGTTGTSGITAGSGTGGLAHWVSVMAEHIHNPHTTGGVTSVHHQQQSPPQAPYPWNNGLSTDVSLYTSSFDSDFFSPSSLFHLFFFSVNFHLVHLLS